MGDVGSQAENSGWPGLGRRVGTVPGALGRSAIASLLFVVDLVTFMLQALKHWWQRNPISNRATRRAVVVQILFSGVDALPLLMLIGLAMGVALTPPLLLAGQSIGEAEELARLLVVGLVLQLGPLLTAVILIGRSGSAIAVDLAQMKLNREVAALDLLGIRLTDYFVAPRLIGGAIAQLALAIYFGAVALIGGSLVSALLLSAEHLALLPALAGAITPGDGVIFVVKNLIFGLIVAGTACFCALKVEVSRTEVPQRTQQAIASSYALVFVMAALFSLLELP
ncbi:MAG: ABC transporter permease [Pseudomonadota bacterium]|nr:ABC transporter permease [Pseudomonadota bacterium]